MPAEPTRRLHLAGYLLAHGEKACTREPVARALHTGLPPTKRNEARRLRQQLGA